MLGNNAIYLVLKGFDLCFEELEGILEGLEGNGIDIGAVFESVEVVFEGGVLFFVLYEYRSQWFKFLNEEWRGLKGSQHIATFLSKKAMEPIAHSQLPFLFLKQLLLQSVWLARD